MHLDLRLGIACLSLGLVGFALPVRAQTSAFEILEIQLRSARWEDARSSLPKGKGTISADVLRHPISNKVRRELLAALDAVDASDYDTAVRHLQSTLEKYPESAAYVHTLLGFALVKAQRFEAAIASLREAVRLFPHDAANRLNLGISLAATGHYDRALEQAQLAQELDPQNETIRKFVAMLTQPPSGPKP